jgi:cysteinyl-tRNA synthetase
MSTECLGDTFDIHGGGPDLLFPHHENEIAQSECATGSHFVNYWMHAGAVRVNKEKMAKSLGNFFTIREILQTYPAEVVRYFLVSSHYRSQVYYSEDNLIEAANALERLYTALRGLKPEADPVETEFDRQFHDAMDDDFNTPNAITEIQNLVKYTNQLLRQTDTFEALRAALELFDTFFYILGLNPDIKRLSDRERAMYVAWTDARRDKDFDKADRLREKLFEKGII